LSQRQSAPAKLNLYLHVVGRRPDGYHLLDSLVAFADIGDEIAAAPADALSLAIEGPFAAALDGPAEDNLVWRAATALARHLGRAPNVALTLAKNLPVASGIGGGSSDAAAALRALATLWEVPRDTGALEAIAASLGADVPVCLGARTAWLGGIGERVEPAPALPPLALVLANPGTALPTAPVFKRRAGPFSQPARFEETPRRAARLVELLAARRNDLAPAAIALVPAVADVLEALSAANGALIARMSGSGATCFALFADRDHAAAAADRLRAAHPRWWVAAGGLLP
jgi:4-diphosphocytidyl-2-C-methyl-D-erythritol kinase